MLQGFVDFLDQKDIEFNEAEFEHKLLELKEIVKDFAEDNPKLSDLLLQVLDEIEQDKAKFMGQDMSVIINQMRYTAIDKEIEKFSKKWYVPFEAVKYEAYNYKDGELANENKLKELADYYDHALIYESGTLKSLTIQALKDEQFRLIEVPFRPTAENFAKFFYEKMTLKGYAVQEIAVYETPNNCAVYQM